MDRRAVLAAGVALLAGCGRAGYPDVTASPVVDPDLAVLRVWHDAVSAVVAAYRATPGSPTVFRSHHIEHLDALGEAVALRTPSVDGSPVASSTTPLPPARGPLAHAERVLASGLVASIVRVRDASLARLGAEIAASAGQHAALLSRLP